MVGRTGFEPATPRIRTERAAIAPPPEKIGKPGRTCTLSDRVKTGWLALPVRESDFTIGTSRGPVRIPTVVVLSRYDRVPMKRPKFSLRGLWQRDGGQCQYTGRRLGPGEGNIDHILPQSRGGETTWENCVLSDRNVNQRKADMTPAEAGLVLRSDPRRPRELPATWFIRNTHEIPDWEVFLPKNQQPTHPGFA